MYLESEALVTREEVAKILASMYVKSVFKYLGILGACRLIILHTFAVEVDREKGFHLDVEDYLAGVLILASELVSFIHFLLLLLLRKLYTYTFSSSNKSVTILNIKVDI